MRFLFLLCFLVGPWAAAEPRVSKIYEIGKSSEDPLFTQITDLQGEGDSSFTSTAVIKDPQGQVIMTERVVVKQGVLLSQYVEQMQTGEAWDLQVKNNSASYKTFKLEDQKKSLVNHKDYRLGKEDFINGPLVETFIEKYWNQIEKGETVKAQLSVLELQRGVVFAFKKTGEGRRNGKSVLKVQMKPANIFISMLVDVIELEIDVFTKKLVYFKGRTPLKRVGPGLKSLDAEIFYE